MSNDTHMLLLSVAEGKLRLCFVYSVLFGCYHQLDESYFHISISAACEESVPKGVWKMEKEIKAENKPSEHLLPFGAI